MKRFILTAMAIVMAASFMTGCATQQSRSRLDEIKEAGKITMAVSPDFAPLEFVDPTKTGDESYVGADIELGRYIAEQLGVELVIEAMDFTAVQAAVTMGSVDMAISGFSYTEERAENMLLSDYYNMDDEDGQGILVLKTRADEFKEAADFTGKLVGAQSASLQYNLVTSQLPEAEVEQIVNLNDAVMMLITEKIDALAVDTDNGASFANNYDEIIMSDFYFDFSSEGNVLAVTKGETELMDAINEILAKVNEEGLFLEWRDDATALADSLGIE
ncbi:MAG: transporter substrate-binding domain-containing protein [Clostridiales bacterium]|jgi:polar amino acid transport system substrate-binding protein|nr:transporter substrate-binding domain-containing protein [Clostridiales bacterium]